MEKDDPIEEPIPEPVFEENQDHKGSGLLSAPAKPKPAAKEKPQEEIRVRSHSVRLDEGSETVITAHHNVSFVPTLSASTGEKPSEEQKFADPWILPEISKILDPVKNTQVFDPKDQKIAEQARKIEELLAKHDANSSVVEIQRGPTFTQFGVEPGFIEKGGRKTRVRISKIESLKPDLTMALSVENLSIEAPIPGKTFIGIQVQNEVRQPVLLREVLPQQKVESRNRPRKGCKRQDLRR